MKFALLATAVAAHTIELHTFEAKNWQNIFPIVMKNGGLSLFGDASIGLGDKGVVTWSQCPDDIGVWTFDTAGSTYSPSPFKKGDTVSLTFVGSVTAPIHIDYYNVETYLNGSIFSEETFRNGGGRFTSAWSLSVSQIIPYFLTPSGHYQVTLQGIHLIHLPRHEQKFVMCVKAEYDM